MTDAALGAQARDTVASNGADRPYAAEDAVARRPLAGDGVAAAFNQLSDEIEARPELAAAIAAGVGLLLGLALGRPSRTIVYLRD